MIDVVILVNGVAEYPEVIYTRQEINHAERVVTSFAQVSEHVLASNLNPVLFNHDPQVAHLVATVRVVYTILLIVLYTVKQAFEEVLTDRGGHHVEMDTCGENSLNTKESKLVAISHRAKFDTLGNRRVEVVLVNAKLNELSRVAHLAGLRRAEVNKRFAEFACEIGRERFLEDMLGIKHNIEEVSLSELEVSWHIEAIPGCKTLSETQNAVDSLRDTKLLFDHEELEGFDAPLEVL